MNSIQKSFVMALTMIAGTTGAFAASAGAKEGGGISDPSSFVSYCTEANPANPATPYVASVTQSSRGTFLYVGRKNLKVAGKPARDHVYSGEIVLDQQVVCIGPCTVLRNEEDGVFFSTSMIGDVISARFESPNLSVTFTCD